MNNRNLLRLTIFALSSIVILGISVAPIIIHDQPKPGLNITCINDLECFLSAVEIFGWSFIGVNIIFGTLFIFFIEPCWGDNRGESFRYPFSYHGVFYTLCLISCGISIYPCKMYSESYPAIWIASCSIFAISCVTSISFFICLGFILIVDWFTQSNMLLKNEIKNK